jgi:hypothetical protein
MFRKAWTLQGTKNICEINEHFCIPLTPIILHVFFIIKNSTGSIFKSAYETETRNCNTSNICQQWNRILSHNWQTRNQTLQSVSSYSYRQFFLLKWKTNINVLMHKIARFFLPFLLMLCNHNTIPVTNNNTHVTCSYEQICTTSIHSHPNLI